MASKIKVAINGINGRMGKASTRLIAEDSQFELVGAAGSPNASYAGEDVGNLHLSKPIGVKVGGNISDVLKAAKPDVLLDFSHAGPAVDAALQAFDLGIRPVIGASGVLADHIAKLTKAANDKHLGGMVVPNFSVGAVLMMEFAQQAGAFFENVEIVEMHHTKKLDAPSGTAMHTVGKLASHGKEFNKKEVDEHELLKNARGGHDTASGVRVHSLRLPGLISHQEVIFGAPGELLTIRHDSFNTDCFLKGIRMAMIAVMNLDQLVVGLDKILSLNATQQKQPIGGRAS
jgi:4-hydroxy-tetrahydrodipicolinate reductase